MRDVLIFILTTPEIRELIIGLVLSVLFGIKQYLEKTKKVKLDELLKVAIDESTKVIYEDLSKEDKRETVKRAVMKSLPTSLKITEEEIDNIILIAYHKFVKGNQNG